MVSSAGVPRRFGISMEPMPLDDQLPTCGEVDRGGWTLPRRRAFANQLVIWVLLNPVFRCSISFSASRRTLTTPRCSPLPPTTIGLMFGVSIFSTCGSRSVDMPPKARNDRSNGTDSEDCRFPSKEAFCFIASDAEKSARGPVKGAGSSSLASSLPPVAVTCFAEAKR